MKLKVDHIGICVERLDQSIIDFYTKIIGCEVPKQIFHLKDDMEDIKYVHMRLADNYVELFEPRKGTWRNFLERNGSGSIGELCFEVENIEQFYDMMREKGITLVDMEGKPLTPDRKWCVVPGDGNRYAYMPKDKTHGTCIEIVEHSAWR